jgi:hypothetical protein
VQLSGAPGRQLLLTASVTLVITIRDTQQTPAQIQQATKVLIEAIGGPTVESLPANASLNDLVATLITIISNSSTPGSTAQELLQTVNDAIVTANLTSIFNNATVAPTGEQQHFTAPGISSSSSSSVLRIR